jgi:hypothetical protein
MDRDDLRRPGPHRRRRDGHLGEALTSRGSRGRRSRQRHWHRDRSVGHLLLDRALARCLADEAVAPAREDRAAAPSTLMGARCIGHAARANRQTLDPAVAAAGFL